jgi:CTP synthase
MIVSLIGDYDAGVVAHQAIPRAIELAANALELDVEHEWVRTSAVELDELVDADAIWCVPASPYANPQAAIDAIRLARENDIPFLGTCGGYQHAALEYARNVLGRADAASSEEDPDASMPLIGPLTCRLSNEAFPVNLEAGTRIAAIYARPRIEETYNCGFGVNRRYLSIFESGDLRFSAFDDEGDPRALEIASHRFFIGTAFQPERSALTGTEHPLIMAFLEAAA